MLNRLLKGNFNSKFVKEIFEKVQFTPDQKYLRNSLIKATLMTLRTAQIVNAENSEDLFDDHVKELLQQICRNVKNLTCLGLAQDLIERNASLMGEEKVEFVV